MSKKKSGKSFGGGSESCPGAIFDTHPSRIRTRFGKKFLDLANKPHIWSLDPSFKRTNKLRIAPILIVRELCPPKGRF